MIHPYCSTSFPRGGVDNDHLSDDDEPLNGKLTQLAAVLK
jgi:hypothetical protein